MTKIVSLIRRAGGTQVLMDDKNYHFKSDTPDGPHVAEVSDAKHVKRFLSIPEGYAELGKEAVAAATVAAQKDAAQPAPVVEKPEEWSNKKAMAYAKEVLGINPKDKNQIMELADKKGVTLEESLSPSAMIRKLVSVIGVEDDADADDGDDDTEE